MNIVSYYDYTEYSSKFIYYYIEKIHRQMVIEMIITKTKNIDQRTDMPLLYLVSNGVTGSKESTAEMISLELYDKDDKAQNI